MSHVHKDITEHFKLCANAIPSQSSVQSIYQNMAYSVNSMLTSGPEKSVAMRKLLESFDAAMRAANP